MGHLTETRVCTREYLRQKLLILYIFPSSQSVDLANRTSIIGNVSLAWIRKAAAGSAPFMAYIGPKVDAKKSTPDIFFFLMYLFI